MVDIWTVHLVAFVVETHNSILLVSNLLFCKIGAIFAFVPRHFEILATALGLCVLIVKRRYIGTAIIILVNLIIHTSTLSISAFFPKTIGFSLLALVTLWVHAVAIVVSGVAVHGLVRILIMATLSSRCRKQYFLVFELLINKVFVSGHTKLWQLDFFLLYDKLRQLPLSSLFIPFCFCLYFVNLIICHQKADHLVHKIEFFGLLSHSIKQLFISLGILLMYILQLALSIFKFWFKFLYNFLLVVNFFLHIVIMLLLFKKFCILAFFFLEKLPLYFFFFF